MGCRTTAGRGIADSRRGERYSPGVQTGEHGSVDVYIGPEPPPGHEANWIRTLPDTGWFPILRFYGPLEPWIDGTWKPDDIIPIDT